MDRCNGGEPATRRVTCDRTSADLVVPLQRCSTDTDSISSSNGTNCGQPHTGCSPHYDAVWPVWCIVVWHSFLLCGAVWYCVVWYIMGQCDAVRCGTVWCSVSSGTLYLGVVAFVRHVSGQIPVEPTLLCSTAQLSIVK